VSSQSPWNFSAVPWGLRQYSSIVFGWWRSITSSPTWSMTGLPSSSSTATVVPGRARPSDPGLIGYTEAQLPMHTLSSVWPYPSFTVAPKNSSLQASRSAPSASPPEQIAR